MAEVISEGIATIGTVTTEILEKVSDLESQLAPTQPPRVRLFAISQLAGIGVLEAVSAISAVLGDKNQDVNVAAILALTSQGEGVIPLLYGILSDTTPGIDTSLTRRKAAAEALAGIGGVKAITLLFNAQSHENSDVRFAAEFGVTERKRILRTRLGVAGSDGEFVSPLPFISGPNGSGATGCANAATCRKRPEFCAPIIRRTV